MNSISQVAVAIIEGHERAGAQIHDFSGKRIAAAGEKEPVLASWMRGCGDTGHNAELALIAETVINVVICRGSQLQKAQLIGATAPDRETIDINQRISAWEGPRIGNRRLHTPQNPHLHLIA